MITTTPRKMVVLIAAASLAGCATLPQRATFSASDQANAMVLENEPIRYWAEGDEQKYDRWGDQLLTDRANAALPLPSTVLALSGGSDKGAFSAGLLNAWTRRGDRPNFDLVSGVSTGALIAPFAFLGSDQDDALKSIYTSINSRDIFRSQVVKGLLGGASMLDTKPLQQLIARHVTPAFLDRIATQHGRGRRLLVMTTNLDAQRGVIWDMGAVASSQSPRRGELFREILLASASIPGAFPPVLVNVTGNGRKFAEMHVDGGTVGGFFLLPRTMMAQAEKEQGRGAIYVFYNGRLQPHFEVTKPRTFGILSRALSTLLGEADRTNIADLSRYAKANAVALTICEIDEATSFDDAPMFDPDRMKSLYALGERKASGSNGCLPQAAATISPRPPPLDENGK